MSFIEYWSGICQRINKLFSHKKYTYTLQMKLFEETLAISEFSQRIEETLKKFIHEALCVYERGQVSAHQTEQMTQQMDALSGLAHAVNSSATEAQLLAVNVLVESAKQSHLSGHFAEMATHVQQLAHQSGEFSDGVLDEVDTAQMAVHQIKALMLKVSRRELEKALSIKHQIDFSLGGLHLLEEALPLLIIPTDPSLQVLVLLAEQIVQQLASGLSGLKQKLELFALDEGCHFDDMERLQGIRKECEKLESARLMCFRAPQVKKIS